MAGHSPPLPRTAITTLAFALLSIIPIATSDSIQVRRVAITVSLTLFGLATTALLVHIRNWQRTSIDHHEQLTARVDSWGVLAGFLAGQTDPTGIAVPIDVARRRRCPWRRGWHSHAGRAGALVVSIGAVVGLALLAAPSPERQAGSARPPTPAQPAPATTTPSTPGAPAAPPPGSTSAAPAPVSPPARRPTPRQPPVTVTRTVTATATDTAPPPPPELLPPVAVVLADSDPPAAEQTGAAPPTSSPPGPPGPPFTVLSVGHG